MRQVVRRWLLLAIVVLPSAIKIPIYRRGFGYKIGGDVKLGWCWIDVGSLRIGDHVRIGNLTRLKGIPEVVIEDYCSIGLGNTFTSTLEFTSPEGRAARRNRPYLHLGKHSQITLLHYFDVQDSITVGAFTVIAGKGSTFFTHYLDVVKCQQATKPVSIGAYCMLGSNVSFVPGASTADCSVVGMGAVVTKSFSEPHVLIAGNPARIVKTLPADAAYFKRKTGWIGTYAPMPPELIELDSPEIRE